MADPNQNNLNDPAKFQEDLAGLNLSRSLAMQQPQPEGLPEDEDESEQNQDQEFQNQERLADETNRQRYLKMMTEQARAYAKERAQQLAKTEAKKYAGNLAKKVVGQEGKFFMRSLLVNPYFWIVVVLFLLLIGMIMITIITAYIACNKPEDVAGGGLKGKVIVSAASFTANFFSPGLMALLENNVCQYVRTGESGDNTAVQPPTGNAPAVGQDLVAITGVPVDGASDPRLRPCMLFRVQHIYNQAKTLGIDFVITSAFRTTYVAETGALSAHARGEAVDIALRPKLAANATPSQYRDFMKKVQTLVGLSQSEGFKPPQGDTLDEYTSPTAAATGGHIHIEYNTAPNNKSYCTNATNYDGN